MKKMIAALLCVLLCIVLTAHAESEIPAVPTPAPSTDTPVAGQCMELTVLGKTLTLDFDTDPMYSMYDGLYVQACFYTYDTDDTLYELYLLFPGNAASGDDVTPESASALGMEDCAVMLYITTDSAERYAVAAQAYGAAYPEGSSYLIHFDSVEQSGSSVSYSGLMAATLVELDEYYNPLGVIDDVTGAFRFTIDFGAAPQLPDYGQYTPETTIPPAPSKLVTPADARKI